MIEGNQLRIGNLVYVESKKMDGRKNIVHTIDKINPQSLHQYDPIPITPEWLERLGFIRFGHLFRLKTNIKWEILPPAEGTTHNTWYVRGYQSYKYVHQIQNLYFALEGEDLEIRD